MSNPSLVWAQLSIPNSPIGSIPYVTSDGATIVTDVLNLFYADALYSLSGSIKANQLTAAGGFRQSYTDTTATPGAATINKPAGRVKLAAGQTSLVITNSYVTATSIIEVNIETADATLTRALVTAQGAGTFTITGNAAATGAVTFSFIVNNVY